MRCLRPYSFFLLVIGLLISHSEVFAQEDVRANFPIQNAAFNGNPLKIPHPTLNIFATNDSGPNKSNIQHSTCSISLQDSTRIYPYNKKRVKWVAGASIAGYGGSMIALYSAWYKNYPQTHFHVFDDAAEWKQMDKLGHVYSAYAESKVSMEMWRWTGIDRKKRIWIGGMSGAAYQTVIEVLDAFSAQWGWSWADFGANVLGSGMLVSQELLWNEQRVQMKWSFNRKRYSDPELNLRSRELFGTSSLERFLKDYNGQTYWLSTGIKPLFPKSRIPEWLQVSVGTGVEGVFGARKNFTEKDGIVTFDRPDIKRVRQWYLGPDVDLSKIKTRKKSIRLILDMLNVIKFPAPALELSDGRLKWNWVAF